MEFLMEIHVECPSETVSFYSSMFSLQPSTSSSVRLFKSLTEPVSSVLNCIHSGMNFHTKKLRSLQDLIFQDQPFL